MELGLARAQKTYPMITSFECIFRDCVGAVEWRLVAEESPTAGERFVEDALAAIGRERRDMRREEVALRIEEANTVAVVACYDLPEFVGGQSVLMTKTRI